MADDRARALAAEERARILEATLTEMVTGALAEERTMTALARWMCALFGGPVTIALPAEEDGPTRP